jgi:hypothetical protein
MERIKNNLKVYLELVKDNPKFGLYGIGGFLFLALAWISLNSLARGISGSFVREIAFAENGDIPRTSVVLTGPTHVSKGKCSQPYSLRNHHTSQGKRPLTLAVVVTTNGVVFGDAECREPITTLTLDPKKKSLNFYFKSYEPKGPSHIAFRVMDR